jgi:acetoin:2,6-dichlorophenolindophenol oxidoreductase subunit beta
MSSADTEKKPRQRARNYLQAIHEAQWEEMTRDPRVIIMGEDLRRNLFGTSSGFLEEFGAERVRDLPLSENGFVGAAVGAAMTGLRPIVDITIASFMYCAMDQLVNEAAKNRYMFGGQADIPVVYRAAMFYSGAIGAHHADRPYPMFMNVPGLKIIAPSTPADMKGLLKAAIREDDPVLCFEDQALWGDRSPLPEGDHIVKLGSADVKRAGDDVTVVAISGAVRLALKAADVLADEGISVEMVDPRSLVPLDKATILASVAKTGRLVVVDMAHRTCSAASEIAAIAAEEVFADLRAPILRVTTPDTQMPFSPPLLASLLPTVERIAASVRRVVG